MVLTRTSKPNRSVELFFIKFFTFWVRYIKKRIDLLKNVIVVHPQFRRRFISIQLRQSLS
ncbi:hypothetical protein DWQ65_08845 [Treponema phagedenis]|nr:hypothetical protein DWQ65_08845 [Treponema phagedenis]